MKLKRFGLLSLSLVLTASPLVLLGSNILNNSPPAESFTTASSPRSAAAPTANLPEASREQIVTEYGRLPLSFEANQGQMDSQAKFVSRGPGYTLFLTGNEAVLALKAADKKSAGTSPEAAHERAGKQTKVPATTSAVLRMQLLRANREAQIAGSDELPGKSNYFIGKEPAQWRTNISNYSKVRYSGIYPGVDLVYYGNQRQLEYDFVVGPGGDPGSIRMGFKGVQSISVDENSGDLILQMKGGKLTAGKGTGGELRFHRPVVYQEQPAVETPNVAANGSAKENQAGQNSGSGPRTFVEGRFVLHTPRFARESVIQNSRSQNPTSKIEVGFEVASYDRSRPLIIDPVLAYSTYLGGTDSDFGLGIAVDASGNAYVTGFSYSADFPTTPGAYQTATRGGVYDAFVTKLNSTGTALLYSTYLGGTLRDQGLGIAVDASGNAYVTGFSYSADFPTTPGAYQAVNSGGADAFLTKLNSTGTALLYSTYLGGTSTDGANGLAVDASGNAYVTGVSGSADFPTTPGAYQTVYSGAYDAFVTKLDPTGTALLYSTYLGGSSYEYGYRIAVDSSFNAYVTGQTDSAGFPTTPGAYQTAYRGDTDAYVTKLNSTGTALLYSTYLGSTNYDVGFAIAVDASFNAYVSGDTYSVDFPITPGAYQTVNQASGGDAFVTKLNATGTALLYSTYLGGSATEHVGGIAVDVSGNAYVTGETNSANFPTTSGAYQTVYGGAYDAFVTKLNATGTALLYSTFLGGSLDDSGRGIAVDASGNAYVTGDTYAGNFPTTPGAYQTVNRGSADAFMVKIANGPTVHTPSSKDDCKNGGWQHLTDDQGRPFKNQGDCVSFVATGGKNGAGG